jgi:hypothetical protein
VLKIARSAQILGILICVMSCKTARNPKPGSSELNSMPGLSDEKNQREHKFHFSFSSAPSDDYRKRVLFATQVNTLTNSSFVFVTNGAQIHGFTKDSKSGEIARSSIDFSRELIDDVGYPIFFYQTSNRLYYLNGNGKFLTYSYEVLPENKLSVLLQSRKQISGLNITKPQYPGISCPQSVFVSESNMIFMAFENGDDTNRKNLLSIQINSDSDVVPKYSSFDTSLASNGCLFRYGKNHLITDGLPVFDFPELDSPEIAPSGYFPLINISNPQAVEAKSINWLYGRASGSPFDEKDYLPLSSGQATTVTAATEESGLPRILSFSYGGGQKLFAYGAKSGYLEPPQIDTMTVLDVVDTSNIDHNSNNQYYMMKSQNNNIYIVSPNQFYTLDPMSLQVLDKNSFVPKYTNFANSPTDIFVDEINDFIYIGTEDGFVKVYELL